MAIIKLSAIERRRLSVFLTCLGAAVCAWVIVTLNNDNTYTVKKAVNFKNSPQRRAFQSLQADSVLVTMKGTGLQMMFSKIAPGDGVIDVDLHTLESKSFVVLKNQLKQINVGRDSTDMILAINPDTLFFDFTNRMIKRVPVTLQSSISYQQRFSLSDAIRISPRYVTISGPASRIAKINEWPTDSLKLRNINENYSARMNLRPVKDGSLMLLPKTVEVNIPVDEFTEKTMEIPVKLINHNFDNVKIFPQKIKLTFTVSLNKYPETDENDFDATADLDLWRNKGLSTLPVNLTRIPPFCKIVSVEPRNIDFIVKK